MKKVRFALFTAALTLGFLCPARAETDFVVNGNFEDPVIATDSISEVSTGAPGATVVPGWTFNYISGHTHEYLLNGNHIDNDINNQDIGVTPFGQQYIGLDGIAGRSFHAIATQTITGLTPGQDYELTLYVANLDGGNLPKIQLTVEPNADSTGDPLATGIYTVPTGGPYGYNNPINFVPETLLFTSPGDTISFNINNLSGVIMGIDNVSMVAVPEPTTLAATLLGAGALVGFVVRRRR